MSALAWILLGGVAMSALALVGGVTLVLRQRDLDRILLPLVAFSAGSLLGGAFFHMLPTALEASAEVLEPLMWTTAGFAVFFALEQFLHWHHCHRASAGCREPLTYLVLIGDALHNFLGGLAVAGAFLTDVRLGVTAWLAAAAHEVPQELGDFGVLVHGGWGRRRALALNVLSASTFLVGGLVAWSLSFRIDVGFLVPFAAGNFLYIGASDLVPEVNRSHDVRTAVLHFASFGAGLGVLLALRSLLAA